jgi:hypothetical protein
MSKFEQAIESKDLAKMLMHVRKKVHVLEAHKTGEHRTSYPLLVHMGVIRQFIDTTGLLPNEVIWSR